MVHQKINELNENKYEYLESFRIEGSCLSLRCMYQRRKKIEIFYTKPTKVYLYHFILYVYTYHFILHDGQKKVSSYCASNTGRLNNALQEVMSETRTFRTFLQIIFVDNPNKASFQMEKELNKNTGFCRKLGSTSSLRVEFVSS